MDIKIEQTKRDNDIKSCLNKDLFIETVKIKKDNNSDIMKTFDNFDKEYEIYVNKWSELSKYMYRYSNDKDIDIYRDREQTFNKLLNDDTYLSLLVNKIIEYNVEAYNIDSYKNFEQIETLKFLKENINKDNDSLLMKLIYKLGETSEYDLNYGNSNLINIYNNKIKHTYKSLIKERDKDLAEIKDKIYKYLG